MSILFLIIFGVIFLFSQVSLSHNENEIGNYDLFIVTSGDTLWQIATKQQKYNAYYQNKDVREIIEHLKKVNSLSTSNLSVGQKLKIPTL